MDFIFNDHNATYEGKGKVVRAKLKGESHYSIGADSFVHAKAAVDARLKRERDAQIEAAWSGRAA